MVLIDKSEIVTQICDLLLAGHLEAAKERALLSLPFSPIPRKPRRINMTKTTSKTAKGGATRKVNEALRLAVWQRDGFRSRYTGTRLVFPQTLELLSLVLPKELPYDNPPHGKYALTHIIMYELFPVVDHVKSIWGSSDSTLSNSLENLVTASAPENSEKSSYDLEHFGWTLLPPEPLPEWDGLTGWYIQFLDQDDSWFAHPTSGNRLMKWHRNLKQV